MKPILTFFCFLLLVCPGLAKDKLPNVVNWWKDDFTSGSYLLDAG